MFAKKVSQKEYDEMAEKYLLYETEYNNEKLRADNLEAKVRELEERIRELTEKGIVQPGLINKYNSLEAEYRTLVEANEKLKASSSAESSEIQELKAEVEKWKKSNTSIREMYELVTKALDEERAKKSKPIGGRNMADNQITKWEYKKIGYVDEKELNMLGEQGWEIAGMVSHPAGDNETFLKRPKQVQTQQKAPEPYPGYSR